MADEPCAAAGTFTTNVMCAAPVTYCRNLLSTSTSAAATTAQVVLTNAACANAATGDLGMADALRSAEEVAKVRKKIKRR